MPSASLQSRIQAFEALSSSSSTPPTNSSTLTSHLLEDPISPSANAFHPIAPFVAPTSSNRSRSPSPSTQASLIDLKDWIVEDGPVEPPPTFRHTLTAGITKLNGIRESSRTPSPSRKPIDSALNSLTPLINFESPPKPKPQPRLPLPPRKPSSNTVDRASTQRSVSAGSENGATLRPPGRSDSLTIEHTYPPAAHKFGAGRVGHASASSISSFHSVSLSSDGSNVEIHSPKMANKPPSLTFEVESTTTDFDTVSITESFENVPVTSAPSPSTAIHFDWEQDIPTLKVDPERRPPALPNRPVTKIVPLIPPKPIARSVSGSSSSTATPVKTRRPPPPPPYQPRSRPSSSRASVVSTSASTSDRSSILSSVTTTSRTSTSTQNSAQFGGTKLSSLLRPTPVPAAARSRYESLFDSAVKGRRKAEKRMVKTKLLSPPPPSPKKGRQAAGWRGLSVDLIANPEDHPIPSSEKGLKESDHEEEGASPVTPDAKLNGRIVKYIWSASRLDRQTLRNIWNDCDPQTTGFVDRDTFVKGMWRVDEELRRTQLARRASALTAASSQRIPHRPLPPPRPQGTRLLI